MEILRQIIVIATVLIFVYIVFGLYLYVNQHNMLYLPSKQDFHSCAGFSDYEKLDLSGTRAYFHNQSSSRIIVYYHGNAGSACDRSHTRPTFESSGASVLYVEYAGYSNDTVKPTTQKILQDVEHVHQFSKSFEEVTVYGQSIGSGAASYHAKLGRVSHVILVSPFASLQSVAQAQYVIYPTSILLRKNFNNAAWLQNYSGRVTIFHGSKDNIILPKYSKDLFDNIPTKNKSYTVVDSGHNDIWSNSKFVESLKVSLAQER